MSQNSGEQGRAKERPDPPSQVQDRVGGGQAQMPVIQPGMGQVQRRPDEASAAVRRPSAPAPVGGGGATTNVVRIFGDYKRTGRFRLEEKTSAMMMFGDFTMDLREAEIPAAAELSIYSLFGDVKIIVPPGMSVSTSGFVILGEDKIEDTSTTPDGPTLRIHRVGAFGDVKIKTALPGEQLPKRWRWF